MRDVWALIESRVTEIIEGAIDKALESRLNAQPRLLDRERAAKALGIHVETLDRWRKLGMPCHRLPGSAPRFLLDECVEWVRTQGVD